MLKYTQFVSQAAQAFETIEVLKATLALKIRVSAVRFCPWPPFKQRSNNKFHGIDGFLAKLICGLACTIFCLPPPCKFRLLNLHNLCQLR